ncbi:MAG TPA: hydrogenase maturation protease [Planctomycetota bacterium]|nr:hydrogenase maturation protease [Planctomycetota bacterium]
MARSVRIIGIGNAFRHDDAAGLIVARQIALRAPPEIDVIEHKGDGAALIDAWRGADNVILIDALQSGCATGTILQLNALATPVPSAYFCCSTHAFNVAEAIELARALNLLPARLELFGIEGRDFSSGEGLSAEVERAIDEAAVRILNLACEFSKN